MRAGLSKTVSALALVVLLSACAAAPTGESTEPPMESPPPQNLWLETDDLAMVIDTTLQIAGRYGKDRVLMVFDIDNTLLAMEQGLGSDQWYYWQKALQERDPCSPLLVSDRLRVQGALFAASAMRLTQDDAADLVRKLQDAQVTVIAVTSRGHEFRLATFRELRRNGISFWPSSLPPQRGFPELFIPDGGTRPARYEDGVFLTAGQHKGRMLKALLDKTGRPRPLVVVVADDKADNLNAFMEAFMGTGTAVHAWRYSKEDANAAMLDTDEAAAIWEDARPALLAIQQIFGPDNFDLPQDAKPQDCGTSD